MYLNIVEARAHMNNFEGAIDDLNVIRIRADIGKINPSLSNKVKILEAIESGEKVIICF